MNERSLLLLLLVWRHGITGSSGWPWTCYVTQAGLKLSILLPQPPMCSVYKLEPQSLADPILNISHLKKLYMYIYIMIKNKYSLHHSDFCKFVTKWGMGALRFRHGFEFKFLCWIMKTAAPYICLHINMFIRKKGDSLNIYQRSPGRI
jgi:hypothetical protein